MWDNQALDWQGWNVVKGSKNRDAAYKFIAFAGRADRQADQTNYISYGPGNKEAIANTNPEDRARSADQSRQHEERVSSSMRSSGPTISTRCVSASTSGWRSNKHEAGGGVVPPPSS